MWDSRVCLYGFRIYYLDVWLLVRDFVECKSVCANKVYFLLKHEGVKIRKIFRVQRCIDEAWFLFGNEWAKIIKIFGKVGWVYWWSSDSYWLWFLTDFLIIRLEMRVVWIRVYLLSWFSRPRKEGVSESEKCDFLLSVTGSNFTLG